MDAIALIEQAKGYGLALRVESGSLKVTGRATDEVKALMSQLSAHKLAIIEILINPLATADLTDYVGAIVDGITWDGLQAECKRRHGYTWHLVAREEPSGWHIVRLEARSL